MNDVLVISSLDTIKALSDPIRLRIVHALQRAGNASASGLGEALGIPPSNISYHLKVLEKHDLVRVAETRMKGNLVEMIYELAAQHFVIQKNLLDENEEEGREVWTRIMNEISALITHDIALAQTHSFISYEDYYLTDEEAKALNDAIDAMLKSYVGRQPGPGLSPYGAGYLFIKRPEDSHEKE